MTAPQSLAGAPSANEAAPPMRFLGASAFFGKLTCANTRANNWIFCRTTKNNERRTALKNYDTGADRVDIVVITHSSDGTLGHAMMSGHQIDPQRSAIDSIKFSAIMDAPDLDGSDAFPFGLAHECGHVGMELIHSTGKAGQMMFRDFHSAADAVDATKRIRELPQAFDRPAGSFRQMQRLHTVGAPVLDGF